MTNGQKFFVCLVLGTIAGCVFNFSSYGDKLCQRGSSGWMYMGLIDMGLSLVILFVVYFTSALLKR